MIAWIVLSGVAAVGLAAVFVRVNAYGSPQLKLLSKGLASLAFVVLGLLCGTRTAAPIYARLMQVGLVLGALGDELLQMMECREDLQQPFFLAGLGSFLLGHVLYIAAFATRVPLTWVQPAAALALFAVIFLLQYPAKVDLGDMRTPVYLYAAVIAVMASYAVAAAVCTAPAFGTLTLLGGALFVISDAVLALMFFSPAKGKALPTVNLITYYAAQILLAFSILAA